MDGCNKVCREMSGRDILRGRRDGFLGSWRRGPEGVFDDKNAAPLYLEEISVS